MVMKGTVVTDMAFKAGEGAFRNGIMVMRMVALSAVSMVLFACQAAPSLVKPRLEEEGQVFVYLQALSPEADRLTFRLEGISAVRGDGTTVPVSLHISEIRGEQLKRE